MEVEEEWQVVAGFLASPKMTKGVKVTGFLPALCTFWLKAKSISACEPQE
jgi:hypothetical protein